MSSKVIVLQLHIRRIAACSARRQFATNSLSARAFRQTAAMSTSVRINGDLNNTEVMRQTSAILADAEFSYRSLVVPEKDDDVAIRSTYRPFLHDSAISKSDWISTLELSTVIKLVEADWAATGGDRLKVLVLFGSLRNRSYSRLLAFEAARILFRLGCDVRVFDPRGLPVKDDVQHGHHKVQELRELSKWSDGHVWVSPEQHGNLTAVFKNQIDWIPLSDGSVRPTQGRTLAIAQVSGGSQSFNTVNSLRMLGRWMRMFTIPNQSSVPKAYTQFTELQDPTDTETYISAEGGSRLMPSDNRDRLVDCMEEFVKYTIVMRKHFDLFSDRFSERQARAKKEAEKAAKENAVNGVDIKKI